MQSPNGTWTAASAATNTTRKMIPAVVVLTRTSPETAAPQRETGPGGRTARVRPRFRSSQFVDQLHGQAEDGEDRHRQQDVDQGGHVGFLRNSFRTGFIGPLRVRTMRTLSAGGCPAPLIDAFLTAADSTFTASRESRVRCYSRASASGPSASAGRYSSPTMTTVTPTMRKMIQGPWVAACRRW